MDKVRTPKFTKISPLLHKQLGFEWLARIYEDAARIFRKFCHSRMQAMAKPVPEVRSWGRVENAF
jgi:UDP-N-acetyl-D-mannosaminuronic acid transferase (WecB/TagA/CpsF family)